MPTASHRFICVQALNRWEEGRKFADEILHETLEASRLEMLDRALLTETFYGILRNLSLLDFLIAQLRESSIDPLTRQILRLGVYQIFHMRIPDHAAVNE